MPTTRLLHRPLLLSASLALALAAALGGCTAFGLAYRGAPPSEMQTFEIEMAAVNLDSFLRAGEGHEHTVTNHDHNAPDHDIDQHIALLEKQLAGTDPAMIQTHHGVELPPYRTVFPESGWVHGFDFEVLDRNGRALPNEILHHLQVLIPDRRELFHTVMLRVAGAGGETRPVSLPPEVGYRVSEGDSLVFTAMLHNPTGAALGDARLVVWLRYSPAAGTWRSPVDVVPFFTHVT